MPYLLHFIWIPAVLAAYGDTLYGGWVADTFGNPSFSFKGGSSTLPGAVYPTAPTILHAAGNDRLSALCFSDGSVSLRQDEGGAKLLHGFMQVPELFQFRGGVGYLSNASSVVAASAIVGTVGVPPAGALNLSLGMGYCSKSVKGSDLALGTTVEHTLLAPFGDDSVLLSLVRLPQGVEKQKNYENTLWTEAWAVGARWEMGWGADGNHLPAHAFQLPWAHNFTLLRDPTYGHAIGIAEVAVVEGGDSQDPLNPSMHDPAPRPAFYVCLSCMSAAGGSGLRSFSTNGAMLYCGSGSSARCDNASILSPLNNSALATVGLDNVTDSFGPASVVALQAPFSSSGSLAILVGYLSPEEDLGCSVSASALAACVHRKVAPYSLTWQDEAARTASAWRAAANGMEFGAGSGMRSAALGARSAAAQSPSSMPPLPPSITPSWVSWEGREAAWHSYMLRGALLHYDSFFGVHLVNQGGNYLFTSGYQAAARDPLAHAMGFALAGRSAERYALDSLNLTMQQKRASTDKLGRPPGSITWGRCCHGWTSSSSFNASDLELNFLFALSQLVLATRVPLPSDLPVPSHPGYEPGGPNLSEAAWHSFMHMATVVGVGVHGLNRLLLSDHNDGLLGSMGIKMTPALMEHAESAMNTALAAYVLPLYSQALALSLASEERVTATAALGLAQRTALNAVAWGANASSGKGWYKRAWLGDAYPGGWLGSAEVSGDGLLWTETQSWALLSGAPHASGSPGRAQTLVELLQTVSQGPSPIGAINTSPDVTVDGGVGYGGVWACGEVALIYALGLGGWADLALEEWRKASLAGHAYTYPHIWFGATAGPDVSNSVYSSAHNATPGSSRCHWNDPRQTPPCQELAFPILNAWPHTLGTYTLPALMGTEWDAQGLLVRPALSQTEYTIFTPLVSLSHWGGSPGCKYAGAWAPALLEGASVMVRVALSAEDKAECRGLLVNGRTATLVWGSGGELIINATLQGVGGVPLLSWELM